MKLTNLSKPRQLSTEVAGQLEREIRDGNLRVGDKLPTEQQLTQAFGVSRNVVREAIARLKSEGFVESRQGLGAFVIADGRQQGFKINPEELASLAKLRKLLELRLELEVAAAGMAARRRTRAQLARLAEAVAELTRAAQRQDSLLPGELSFSRALAEASGNEYFDNFILFLAGHLFEALGRVKPAQALFAREAATIVAERREIQEAIVLGDPDLARRATWRHILNTADRLGLKGLQGWERTRMSALGETHAPLCLPPDPSPRQVHFAVPAGACDCHMHVFGPSRRYPLTPHRSYTPAPASLAGYRKVMTTLGLSRAVVVQPSVYGTDNRMLLEVLRKGGEQFRGVVVIDPDTPEAELQAMHELGVRGVRINLLFKSGVEVSDVRRLAARVAPFGWHLQMLIDVSEFSDLYQSLGRLPVQLVIDHMGHMPTQFGVEAPGFQEMLALARDGRAWIKLSGAERISGEAYPYADVAPFARAILAAAPERTLWASDWPHTGLERDMPNDGGLLELVHDWAADPLLLRKILVDNPQRLYGFAPLAHD
ncbi:GntR family transcriptional regulator [Zobellella endophytica]|uniref:GntR family transcriptional regulator n=1 Tax=Zobellella endophytica TaxID=2116700 RepID=A0A2P7R0I7_9GAMM|nr:amidohydrolase family protein [Zobellella endophytica]PSJ43727.1 GntR family transcriptional regulator [Zobellella endophytica]